LGNLQHSPQLTHSPLRLLETGSIEVQVLFILADHVFFLFLSAIGPKSQKHRLESKRDNALSPACAKLSSRFRD
jgi:hypothetical protein